MDKGNKGLRERLREVGSSKYRLRILLTFFAVAVVAIAVIDIAVFQGLFSQIREDSEKENRVVLRNLNESYENQIGQYRSQAQLLYRNAYIKAYLTSNGREDSHINPIYESLRAVAGNTQGITSVILFNKDTILASYDTGTINTEVKKEIVNNVVDTTSDKEMLFCYTDAKRYKKHLVMFCSDREYLYGPGSYGVVLVINLDEVQSKTLPPNREAENPVYIFYRNGEQVAAQNDSYQELAAAMSVPIMAEAKTENAWKGDIDGRRQTASYVWSDSGDFFSVKVQQTSFGQQQIDRALRTILISTILGMAVVAVIVWFLSGRLYRPLSEMFRNILALAQSEQTAGQGKDEMVLAADALQDVNQNMIFLKSQIRTNGVIRFLRQGGYGEGIEQALFDFGESVPDIFEVLVLRYWMEDWEKNDALLAYLSEAPPKYQAQVENEVQCYRMSRGEICILCGMEPGRQVGEETSRGYAEEILEELMSLYQIRGCIGMARCDSLEGLPQAYQKAALLTEYYILSKDILVMDEALLKQKNPGAVEEEEREKILQIIKDNQQGSIPESLHRLLKNLTSYHSAEAQKYLKELVADVIRLSENIAGEKKENYEMYLEDFLTNQIFIGQVDIEEWLCELFMEVKEQLQAGRESAGTRVMRSVIDYIGEYYWRGDLSAESVAERYGLSLSYFSKLFNAYTGKTFPDYINQQRLQNAREILQNEPHMSIQEISKKVGFNSSSYFSAAFRRYYGVSPSQIRKIKKS